MRAMVLYDHRIEEVVSALIPQDKTPELIQSIRACLNEKDTLCKAILELDHAVIQVISKEQQRLSRLVTDSDKNRDLLNRFKSTWIPESGESLDGRI
jgi:hypothetical protein